VRETLLVAVDVNDALGHAHAKGIVHRDVKPENILLAGDGAYLMDFGFANTPETPPNGGAPKNAYFIVGTPDYVSPEQVAGKQAADWRSDFFSLGCVMYEMLTGTTPFAGGSPRASMMRRLTQAPPDARSGPACLTTSRASSAATSSCTRRLASPPPASCASRSTPRSSGSAKSEARAAAERRLSALGPRLSAGRCEEPLGARHVRLPFPP
jgi:serine/threonine-protein kinase